MIRSMTGFGRCETVTDDYKIVVEMKSVNHRYLDLSIKMPKKFNYYEAAIRNLLKDYVVRGKVDVYVTFEDYTEEKACVKYNHEVASEYIKGLKQLSQDFQLPLDINVAQLSRYPDVFSLEEKSSDEETIFPTLKETIKKAASQFVETRIVEGERLQKDICEKLVSLEKGVDFIEAQSPIILNQYRERLYTKVNELLEDTQIDESLLATELVIYADKICVDEETVRLRSHIHNMNDTLSSKDSIGRKLDFIAQEMNREANTILSKANAIDISNCAIDLKTEIEKIREQIQNIE